MKVFLIVLAILYVIISTTIIAFLAADQKFYSDMYHDLMKVYDKSSKEWYDLNDRIIQRNEEINKSWSEFCTNMNKGWSEFCEHQHEEDTSNNPWYDVCKQQDELILWYRDLLSQVLPTEFSKDNIWADMVEEEEEVEA